MPLAQPCFSLGKVAAARPYQGHFIDHERLKIQRDRLSNRTFKRNRSARGYRING